MIFDIVNNIENLYSIDSVEAEMQNAILYFRRDGLDKNIVNDHFRVMDEVRNCREMFDKLNDTLSSSWDLMYGYAKLNEERKARLAELGVSFSKDDPWEVKFALSEKYYREHGNLNVPPKYKADGIWLAKWLNEQRQIYIGNRNGKKTDRRTDKTFDGNRHGLGKFCGIKK